MDWLKNALAYRKIGWSVLPMRPANDPHPNDPDGEGKIPYVKWKQYQTKLPSEKTIRRWAKQFPKAQMGIVTGKASGFLSFDFDSPAALESFRSQYDLPDTIYQDTGRLEGGKQFLFKYPDNGTEIRNSSSEIMDDVDVRGEGGLIMIPPSLHKSGKHYRWGKIDPTEDGLDDLMEMTDDMLALCTGQKVTPKKEPAPKPKKALLKKPAKDPNWVDNVLMGVGIGQRDVACTRLAGYYVRMVDKKEILPLLLGWNSRNTPPMEEAQVEKCVKSILDRVGMERLSDVVGHSIYQFEIMNYPDGEVSYKVYVHGEDKHITLEPDDLVSSFRFRKKFMVLTKKVMGPVSNKEWWPMIQQVLSESTEITMSEDETHLAVIRRMILTDISRGEYEAPETFLDNMVVLYNDEIHLYLEVLARNLNFAGIRISSQKEMGAIIRRLGFKNKACRINAKLVRTWHINYDEFMASSQLVIEE